jgi:hypothetical protein
MMPSRPAAPSPSAAEPPHDGDVMALAKIRALGHSAGAR